MAPRYSRSSSSSVHDDELAPIVRVWILRVLVELKCERKFITTRGFSEDDLARAIGLESLICEEFDSDFNVAKAKSQLRSMHLQLEKEAHLHRLPAVLVGNIRRTAELVDLSEDECAILGFTVLMHGNSNLREACQMLGYLNAGESMNALAGILHLPKQSVRRVFQAGASLTRSGLVTLQRSGATYLADKLELLSESLPEILNESEVTPSDWLKDRVSVGPTAHLAWSDYEHINTHLAVARPYLRHALATGKSGVNIFVYGRPGTGKTQLAKLLAQDLECELFEVATETADGEPHTDSKRVRALCAANSFFAKRKAMILFDEVEEVFHEGGKGGGFASMMLGGSEKGHHSRKGWLNRILENNPLPTIWVANSHYGLDPAFVRRFDIVLHVPIPPRSHRERIIRASCNSILPAQVIEHLSTSEDLAPAVITRASDVVSAIHQEMAPDDSATAVTMLINSTLKAQGHKIITKHSANQLPDIYDPSFINAPYDLSEVARQLMAAGSGRLCLYGPPGTGKTAYARWLAKEMGVPLIVKRASDLLGMYVGQSEARIASAFEQAEAEKSILLIDEVDSFLRTRESARSSWEVSMVNEMLAQMETFTGVFIASTNLMGDLDAAVLRRFDLKMRFDFLLPDQAQRMLHSYLEQMALPAPEPGDLVRLSSMKSLTPGDFAQVRRQSRLRPMRCAADWVSALADECALKPGFSSAIGFVH